MKVDDLLTGVVIGENIDGNIKLSQVIKFINDRYVPNFTDSDNLEQRAYEDKAFTVEVTGKIKSPGGDNGDGTELGILTLETSNSKKNVIIDRCTTIANPFSAPDNSSLWFDNPKDFLRNDFTRSLKVGDEISVVGTLIVTDGQDIICGYIPSIIATSASDYNVSVSYGKQKYELSAVILSCEHSDPLPPKVICPKGKKAFQLKINGVAKELNYYESIFLTGGFNTHVDDQQKTVWNTGYDAIELQKLTGTKDIYYGFIDKGKLDTSAIGFKEYQVSLGYNNYSLVSLDKLGLQWDLNYKSEKCKQYEYGKNPTFSNSINDVYDLGTHTFNANVLDSDNSAVTNATLSELINKYYTTDAKDVFRVTVKIVSIENLESGFLYFTDENGSNRMYVYGLTATPGCFKYNFSSKKYGYINPDNYSTNELPKIYKLVKLLRYFM